VAVHYIGLTRRIVSAERTGAADTQLGLVLTFVAGATNAGGFLAVGQYTSHMSGIFSAMADHLALGAVGLVLVGLGALLAFMAGAACSAMLINWGHASSMPTLPWVASSVSGRAATCSRGRTWPLILCGMDIASAKPKWTRSPASTNPTFRPSGSFTAGGRGRPGWTRPMAFIEWMADGVTGPPTGPSPVADRQRRTPR
jgi:hypothetical protein